MSVEKTVWVDLVNLRRLLEFIMSKKVQRQYSAELKSSAVKMVIEELKTLSQVSQDLDIPLQTLHSWVNKGRKGELSGIGTYNPDLVALQTEVRQLKKQLAAAEMEREILKKAAAYFARDTLPNTRS